MKAYTWVCSGCNNPIKDGDDFFIAYQGYMSGNSPCIHKRLIMLHWGCYEMTTIKEYIHAHTK